MKKEQPKYEGIPRHAETLYIKDVFNDCDKQNNMKNKTIKEVAVSYLTHNNGVLKRENEELKDKLKKIENYCTTDTISLSINSDRRNILRFFFETLEQKQATSIIENASEELLEELKKQLQ